MVNSTLGMVTREADRLAEVARNSIRFWGLEISVKDIQEMLARVTNLHTHHMMLKI